MTLTDVERKLAERYGRNRSTTSRRLTWTIVGAVAVAATALLAWSTLSNALNSVDADSTGFRVLDEHTVEVSFQVSIRPDTKVACALEAQDPDHGIVGFTVVEVASSDAHTRSLTERIPTTAEATTGFVRSCWIL